MQKTQGYSRVSCSGLFLLQKRAPVKYAIRHGTHSICAPKPNKLGTLLMYLKPSLVHLHSPSIASVERGATKSSKTSATLKPFHLLHGVLNKVYPHQVSKRHPFFPFRSSTRITFLFTTAGHATVILQGPHSSSRRILDSKS